MTRNLCSLERVRFNLPTTTSADDRTIAALIAAASNAICQWCRRDFTIQRYDELYDGMESELLQLRQYPIASIETVRRFPTLVLTIENNDTANQRANVAVTDVGVELVRIAAGVMIRDTGVTFASHPTLHELATAITAVSGGWNASVVGSATGDYGAWPSQDLYVPPSRGDGRHGQGPLDCRGRSAGLRLHVEELSDFTWTANGRLHRDGSWSGGVHFWRITYSAGYAELPEAIVEACAEWVSILFEQTRRDPSLAGLTVSGAISQHWSAASWTTPPPRIAALLAPHRRFLV